MIEPHKIDLANRLTTKFEINPFIVRNGRLQDVDCNSVRDTRMVWFSNEFKVIATPWGMPGIEPKKPKSKKLRKRKTANRIKSK